MTKLEVTKVESKGFSFETAKPIVRINRAKLIGIMYKLPRSEIITLHTNTDPGLRKTSKIDKSIRNPFVGVRKCSKVNGFVEVSYESCVNRQLEREGKEADFKAEKRQWGSVVNDTTKTVVHHVAKESGEYAQYINFNPRHHLETHYVDENNKMLDKSDIEQFISDKKPSSRQGTDKEVVWRTYKAESIVAVATKGILYVVQD